MGMVGVGGIEPPRRR